MRWLKVASGRIVMLAILSLILAGASPSPVAAQGTAAGTVITNTATLNYNDTGGTAQPAVTTNTASVTVTQEAAVEAVAASSSAQGTASQVLYYAVTVTNQGNGADTLTLAATSASSPAWTVAIYKDDGAGGGTASDGIHQSGETTVAANTGSLAADATFKCFVAVTVPAGTAYGTVDTTTLTATSQLDSTKKSTVTLTTTVQGASMTVTKSADKAQAKPGDTIRYTITYNNVGDAAAASVTITDTVPTAVTYVANSVRVNSSSRTDASDGDGVIVASGLITVNLGTIAAGGQGTITFDVTVN